ncbi:MAG: hypothetical protein ACR2J9_00200 [Gaiellales bacterium]
MRRLLPLLAIGAIALAACGGSPTPQPTTTTEPKPLTMIQAQLLASAQFLNYRNKGAEFEMEFGVTGTSSHFTMQGQMNWDDLVGNGVITPDNGQPIEVWWRTDIVVQSDPQLAALLQAADQQPVFVGHAPNTAANPIDKACAIMLHLGSKQRDNPILVRQQEGSAYLGEADVRGTPTQILRYGEINRFWIDPKTGLMLRFAGNGKAGKSPETVDLLTHEAQTIYAPPGRIVSVSQGRKLAAQYGIGS